jgi:hypothetical protein
LEARQRIEPAPAAEVFIAAARGDPLTPPGVPWRKTLHLLCAAAWLRKAIAMTDPNSDEEMMVAEASYPLRGAGRKFSGHTNRQVENFA